MNLLVFDYPPLILLTMKYLIFFLLCYAGTSLAQDSLSNYTIEELRTRYSDVSDHPTQLIYAEAMLQKGEQSLDKQDTAYAKLLFYMGNTKSRLGAAEEAFSYLEAALKIQESKIPQGLDYAETLYTLGRLYMLASNEQEKPLELFLKALPIRKKHAEASDRIALYTRNRIALIYTDRGKLILQKNII